MFEDSKIRKNTTLSLEGPASAYKVAAHQQRIRNYLAGEKVYPVTLELDLTSQCNHQCPDCPSTRASESDSLDFPFVEKIFSLLEGETPGLLLTGGEPTLSPLLPQTIGLAKKRGFSEIAVVTNGSRLSDPEISDSLLEHATTIRLSLYDRDIAGCDGIQKSLENVEHLRNQIDRTQSHLKIGISILTSTDKIPQLETIVDSVYSAGAHWIYFHPMCIEWGSGAPIMENQTGIEEKINFLKGKYHPPFSIFHAAARYGENKLIFNGYHGAHFLMIVGANGQNYLGAEVKYQPDHIIADLTSGLNENTIWSDRRREKISQINSRNYTAIGSRHRGGLYSDFIEKLIQHDPDAQTILETPPSFLFPSIL